MQSADGCEANLQTDNNDCGACGKVCTAGAVCTSGQCALTVGNSTALTCNATYDPFATNTIGAIPFTVPTAMTITQLGIYAVSGGVAAEVALYADASGKPGAELRAAPGATLATGTNIFTLSVPLAAPANTTYWIAAQYGAGANICASAGTQTWLSAPYTFGLGFPANFPTPTGMRTNIAINYWAIGHE